MTTDPEDEQRRYETWCKRHGHVPYADYADDDDYRAADQSHDEDRPEADDDEGWDW